MDSAVPFVFLGTPRFGAIVLKSLIEKGLVPSLVVCNPDQALGRKKTITSPPTKRLAEEYGIPIWQPEKLTEAEAKRKLGNADIAVVAAYGKIIPASVLRVPKNGTLGIHPSLLPQFRGATPLQSAILAGFDRTGVSLFVVDEKVDHGSVVAERTIPLAAQTYLQLEEQLAALGAELFAETIRKFLVGEIIPVVQHEEAATFTKKIATSDAFVEYAHLNDAQKNGGDIAIRIDRMVRAFTPEPGVWTLENGVRMKLLEAELLSDGKLRLHRIQYEGKKPQALG